MMSLKDSVQAALSEVQRRTQIDKCEHGILLARDGRWLSHSQGDEHSVMVPEHYLRDSGQCIFVHSHPVETPMSLPDNCCSAYNQMPIYAITPENWISWSNPTDVDSMMLYRTGDSIHDQVGEHMRKLGYWFDRSVSPDPNDPGKCWNVGVQAQVVNAMMRGKGFIDYHFTAPKSLVEKLDESTIKILQGTPMAGKFSSWMKHGSYSADVQVS